MITKSDMNGIRRLLLYDFLNSIKYTKMRMLIAALLPLILLIDAHVKFLNGSSEFFVPSSIDVLASINIGSEFYDPQDATSFDIPIIWITIQVVFAYLIGFYPYDDLNNGAANVVTRAKHISLWWASKCVWIITAITAIYALGFIEMCFYALMSDNNPLDFHSALVFSGYEISEPSVSMANLCVALTIPFFVSIAMSLTQVVISLFFGPALALGVVVAFLIISLYIHKFPFMADCGMLLRNEHFSIDGYSSSEAIILCIFVSVALMWIGKQALCRKDISINRSEKI